MSRPSNCHFWKKVETASSVKRLGNVWMKKLQYVFLRNFLRQSRVKEDRNIKFRHLRTVHQQYLRASLNKVRLNSSTRGQVSCTINIYLYESKPLQHVHVDCSCSGYSLGNPHACVEDTGFMRAYNLCVANGNIGTDSYTLQNGASRLEIEIKAPRNQIKRAIADRSKNLYWIYPTLLHKKRCSCTIFRSRKPLQTV